jgi:glycerophosphoryl diester phosphodiesterase
MILTASCKQAHEVLVVAHRGASAYAPENTLIAIKKAMDMEADYAELDVQLTKDKEVILLHDMNLKRTAGIDALLRNLTLEELKKLEAGAWFGKEFRGEPIPTLQDVIRLVKGKMRLNIEIKTFRPEPEIAQKVVDIIRSEHFENQCMVTSFNREVVIAVKRIAPEIITGFIFGKNYPDDVFKGSWDVLSCNHRIATPEFIQKAREHNKQVYVWTIDSEKSIKRFIDRKVDGIISNKPDLVKKILKD